MLDSKAVASITEDPPGQFNLFIRGIYLLNLEIYSFTQCPKVFSSLNEAMMYFKLTYPNGSIVPFENLTDGSDYVDPYSTI